MSRFIRRAPVPLVFVLALGMAKAQDPDPVYDEKKASEWVRIVQDDTSARKRSLAVTALAAVWNQHQYKDALPNIGRTLRVDKSPAVRLRAAAAIATLKPDDAKKLETDIVDAAKNETESAVRREIAATLGRFPEVAKNAAEPLTAMLKDPDPATRAAAAETLAKTGAAGKAAAPDLLALLGDSDKAVRRAAVVALGRVMPENPSFVGASLVKLLADEKDAEIRREVLVSLGLLGDKSEPVVAGLVAALNDPDVENRAVAVRTLGTFGTAAKPAADALLKFAGEAKDKGVRVDAVRAFGSSLGPELKGRLPDLIALLDKEPDFEVRVAIVEEIGALGNAIKDDKEAMAALRKRLSDPQVKVREAAATAIRRVEKPPEKKPEKK